MTKLPLRVARWSAGHPWRAIAGWFLFVALCLGVGMAVGGHAATSEDFRIGEAGRAESLAAAGGLEQRAVERVLITARPGGGPLDRHAAAAAALDVVHRMKALPEVDAVSAPVRSADRTAVRVDVTLKGPELDAENHLAPLRAETARVQAARPGLRIEQTGGTSIGKAVDGLRDRDLSKTELIALPITLVTMLLVFASVAMALMPLLLAVSSIVAAVGLSLLASHAFPDSGVGVNIILLIGMAVGVDYTLFYLKREREERARADGALSPRAVVELAAATSGRAVLVSGLAVMVSSATLYLADDVIFSSIATAAIVVTLVAVASSMTVLPALLAKLGARAERRRARRGDRPTRFAWTARTRRTASGGGPVTSALLRATGRHPVATLAAGVVAMLALAAPLLGLNLTDMGPETYPRSLPAMQAFDRLNRAFPELKATNRIVVRADAGRRDEVTAALRDLAARAESDPDMAGTARLRTSPDGRVSLLELAVPHYVSDKAALRSLETVRKRLLPDTVGRLPGVEAAVTGDVARYADYPEHQKRKLPLIIGALLAATFAMTVWAFRSVVLGLVGMLLNLLSAGASLGLLVLVFQGRWAEGPLAFHSTGSVGSRVPLLLFVILFGLSMDYQVFVISRIREAAARGVPARQAVLDGIGGSAGVVTSAAFVMVTVFASFVPLHIMEMKQMGFSLAAAVLLDAFVIRVVILPALMLLLGDAVWWPSRSMRRTQGGTHRTQDGTHRTQGGTRRTQGEAGTGRPPAKVG
ncbi:MMPL family transporter [Actinomadura rupiterrae]|uniref:MMPL family transporter n=1 Tax=Actinomadura rupiterrae TaxID=559627 RepID=UPI0020A334E0|nr:MMPL family transporter [Actinomadura rupiterrae]MCP2341602.1 RND superfamily putative drug exporter [Actinomadura rupiterrae]